MALKVDWKPSEKIITQSNIFKMMQINGFDNYQSFWRWSVDRSVIEIANSWEMKVEERKVSVKEIIESIENGSLTEMFGVGTAATIVEIIVLNADGKDYELNPPEKRKFSPKVGKYLNNLKKGRVDDPFGWVIKL